MNKPSPLTQKDLRNIYLLLGECLTLGTLPAVWIQRVHEELSRLLGVQFSVVMEGSWDLVLGRRAPGSQDHVLTFGSQDTSAGKVIREYFQSGALYTDPCVPAWIDVKNPVATRLRQQLVRDADWYNSMHYNDFFVRTRTDQSILTRCPTDPGRGLMMYLWRHTGDKPFTQRDLLFVELLQQEIHHFIHNGRLNTFKSNNRHKLAPRLLQVMNLLAAGLSEKEVSDALGISRHTCHDYVKKLHRHFGVSNRSELIIAIGRSTCSQNPKQTQ
jgi:DNA-binding CsgD family transcriptional regulator